MFIQVAETCRERDEVTNSILINNILQQLALMILAAISVKFGISRSLRPLEKISNAIAAQSPSKL
jgi:HAMP domain-containing protein